MDQRLIEALRAKYQYDMKKAVAEININLSRPTKNSMEIIDNLLDEFKNAKDKGGYFESILNTLKPNQENEN